MKLPCLLIVCAALLMGCQESDRHISSPLAVSSAAQKTAIECRPCDPRSGPAIIVDFPISSTDETAMDLCWVRDDRCWYGCETTGEVGGKGCNLQ